MLSVCATFECCTSSTIISPDHSVVSSLDLSLGQTLSWVSMWHFLHACSLAMLLSHSPLVPRYAALAAAFACFWTFATSSSTHSSAPRKGCRHVTPILPIEMPCPRLTAVILTLTLLPTLSVLLLC